MAPECKGNVKLNIVNDFCVTADAELLRIAIHNLISNAVKYSCGGNDRAVDGSRDQLSSVFSDEVADGNASNTACSAFSKTTDNASSETADSASSKIASSASSKFVGGDSVVVIIDSPYFIIEDQGIGIPESDLANIFQPFYRASNVGAVSGKGVGLALSKSIL